jgi:hypothetical protein
MFKPNFFILGAAKSGTTTLHQYLESMPDIVMSNPKEPFFFEAEYEKGLEYYRKTYFKHWQAENIIGESRHRNLYLPYIPERIYKVNPQAKLLVIVRNPIKRAYSHWNHFHSRNADPLNFHEAIIADIKRIDEGKKLNTPDEIKKYQQMVLNKDAKVKGTGIYRTYVDSGFYSDQIKRYCNLFSKSNLKVILFEELISSPDFTIKSIIEFLSLNTDRNRVNQKLTSNTGYNKTQLQTLNWVNKVFPVHMKKIVPQKLIAQAKKALLYNSFRDSQIPPMTGELLANLYKEYNLELGAMIEKDLSSWEKWK